MLVFLGFFSEAAPVVCLFSQIYLAATADRLLAAFVGDWEKKMNKHLSVPRADVRFFNLFIYLFFISKNADEHAQKLNKTLKCNVHPATMPPLFVSAAVATA